MSDNDDDDLMLVLERKRLLPKINAGRARVGLSQFNDANDLEYIDVFNDTARSKKPRPESASPESRLPTEAASFSTAGAAAAAAALGLNGGAAAAENGGLVLSRAVGLISHLGGKATKNISPWLFIDFSYLKPVVDASSGEFKAAKIQMHGHLPDANGELIDVSTVSKLRGSTLRIALGHGALAKLTQGELAVFGTEGYKKVRSHYGPCRSIPTPPPLAVSCPRPHHPNQQHFSFLVRA